MLLKSGKVALFVFVYLALSCTVLEDRGICPCRLTFASDVNWKDVSVSMSLSDGSTNEIVIPFLNGYCLEIIRDEIRYSVARNVGDESTECLSWVVEEGDDFPALYLSVSEVDTRCEEVTEIVTMHKVYCKINVRVDCGDGDRVVAMRVRSNVSGYGSRGECVLGAFVHVPELRANGIAEFKLPRQVDNTLAVEVEFEKSGSAVFPLGLYMERSGYDWNEPDLQDAEVEFSVSSRLFRINTSQWRRTLTFDLCF